MRISTGKIFIGAAAIIFFGFAVYQIFSIRSSVQNALAEENARLKNKNLVPFEKKSLAPHSFQNFEILQNATDARDFIKFQNSYFAATSGGLTRFDETGKISKHFTVAEGLPESDLTALAVFADKLFIGTRTKNLLAFDGEKFEQFVFNERDTQAVAALLAADGGLYIGTANGGLLKFDGAKFSEMKINDDKKFPAITCLAKLGAALFVGTFNDGLWIYEADIWTHFTTAENLPSNRVVAVFKNGETIYAATDFGLAVREENVFRKLAVLPALSGGATFENRIFLTKDDGTIFTFENALKEFSASKQTQNARFAATDGKLFLASNQDVSEIVKNRLKNFSQTETDSLTDNFVSALTFDKSGNFWVGTFRRGIDVFSPTGKKIKHIETETAREINFLHAESDTIRAATSSGLLEFKSDFSIKNLTENKNLPSRSITHFTDEATATAKGLAFVEKGNTRVLSTVQNLPNNAVYTTLRVGAKLYAGTLGGLAEIENNRVVRQFRDTNSNLKTNWVTALICAEDRIFIGTYGGGIFELGASGEIRSFESATGKFVVNPNAFYTDGERLYAGTLQGVKVLDLATQKWTSVKEILPADTVLSITGDAENIYFGTTNGIAQVGKDYFANGEKNAN